LQRYIFHAEKHPSGGGNFPWVINQKDSIKLCLKRGKGKFLSVQGWKRFNENLLKGKSLDEI
jgi:hypothetical protein